MSHSDTYKNKSDILPFCFVIGFDLAKSIYDRKNSIDKFPYNCSLDGFHYNEFYYNKNDDILYCGYTGTSIVYNLFS